MYVTGRGLTHPAGHEQRLDLAQRHRSTFRLERRCPRVEQFARRRRQSMQLDPADMKPMPTTSEHRSTAHIRRRHRTRGGSRQSGRSRCSDELIGGTTASTIASTAVQREVHNSRRWNWLVTPSPPQTSFVGQRREVTFVKHMRPRGCGGGGAGPLRGAGQGAPFCSA